MSERTEKSEKILQIELQPDYAKIVVEIGNLYGDALMDIAEQEICCKNCLAMKEIATDAVIKAFAMTQAVKAKIARN